jgi:aminoglycoside 3-N-acetyltransferase
MVTRQDICDALHRLGVKNGDICLFHSSFKSLGPVDGGADAVIGGFEDAIGPDGTLVAPTLCSSDFFNSYINWHLDKPSEVGYLPEYFRKLPRVLRSNQATHSVAARGKLAYELTYEHAAYGYHLCPFGETAFADSSPWVKMYNRSAKVVFLGVTMRYNTFKHMIEGRYTEELLANVRDPAQRENLNSQLWTFDNRWQGVWLFYNSVKMQEHLASLGLVTETTCGNATVYCVDTKAASDAALEALRAHPERWYEGPALEWINACKAAV